MEVRHGFRVFAPCDGIIRFWFKGSPARLLALDSQPFGSPAFGVGRIGGRSGESSGALVWV